MEAEKAFRQRMQEKYFKESKYKQTSKAGKVLALLSKKGALRFSQIAAELKDKQKNLNRVLRPLLEDNAIQRLLKGKQAVYYSLSNLHADKEFRPWEHPTSVQEKLLNIICQKKRITRQKLIKEYDFSPKHISEQIQPLIEAGLIVKKPTGSNDKSIYYQCALLDAKFAKFTAEFVRFMLTLLDFEPILGRFWQHGY